MQEAKLNSVIEDLKSLYDNIKAEAVVIELQRNSSLKNDFVIQNKSSFMRSHRRDILKSRKIDNKLLIELSRNGIYDSLPEGFFHSNIENKSDSYNRRRNKKKKEEKDGRLLFSPIENELFNQAVEIDKKERELFDDFYNFNTDFLLKFWNLKEHINNKYILKLAKLLPHSHKIAGDLKLIKLCLERVIGEKVEIVKSFEKFEILKKIKSEILGVDLITKTEKSNVAVPFITFKIGPVANSRLKKYYENEEIKNFLKIFYSYFLPLELQAQTCFLSGENQKFILDEESNPIMGVSTKI